MPSIIKRGPCEETGDLGQVTVIDRQQATATVERYRFEVTEKRRERFRRVKSETTQKYGGAGAEEPDDGGICAGETLRLSTRFQITEGRHVSDAPHSVPEHVINELLAAGAAEVLA